MDIIPRDERAVSDLDFLRALDPNRRDLAGIRRTAEAGDLDGARRALVAYFRTRRRPRWFFDLRDGRRGRVFPAWPDIEQGDRRRADPLLQNRFFLREDDPARVWDFGKGLRWRTAEMRQQASTAYRFKRGNFFRDLAMAYGETGRPAYAAKFAEFAKRWRRDWPLVVDAEFHPDTAQLSRSDGHDTMTTAFRWMAWMDCLYGGIAFAPEVSVGTTFGLIKALWFIAIQYRHYERSVYRSANHHLFERGMAPLMFGVMLPEFPEVTRDGDGFVAARGGARLRIRVASEGKVRMRLYRDSRWLRENPLHPGEAAPWVLDVTFGGLGDDLLETRFDIFSTRGR